MSGRRRKEGTSHHRGTGSKTKKRGTSSIRHQPLAISLPSASDSILFSEVRRVLPRRGGLLKILVAYPNTYEIGMSNLGLQSLLELTSQTGFFVDRIFMPHGDEQQDLGAPRPMLSLETGTPMQQFDVILFSVSFEPDYVGLVRMLRWAAIEPWAEQRSERTPLIVAGGIAPTLNPEPLAPFCDLIGIGEAEALLPSLMALLDEQLSRVELLEQAGCSPGWYWPARGPYRVVRQHGPLVRPCYPAIFASNSVFSTHVDVEINRGCRWRCRFCAAGFVIAPYRELSLDMLQEALCWGLQHKSRIGLVGADVSDHSQLEAIANDIWTRKGEVALPSLRVENLGRKDSAVRRIIQRRPPHTLTMAVEAASEELRHAIGKRLDQEQIIAACSFAAQAQVQRLRVYLLVGIPGERWSEVEAIPALIEKMRRLGPAGRLTLSVNGLVPKAGTPLQWAAPPARTYLAQARKLLRDQLSRENIKLTFESPGWTRWQAILSLGDRQLSAHILQAAEQGWRRALARAERDITLRGFAEDVPLPWEHIEHPIPREALRHDYECCLARKYEPPRRGSDP